MREIELDIALIAGNLLDRGVIDGICDSREFLLVTVPQWAKEFEAAKGIWWEREDYLEAIERFSERKLTEKYKKRVLIWDGQLAKYSAHTTIDGMFDMLALELLHTSADSKEYELNKRWIELATENTKRSHIKAHEYVIVDNPTIVDIKLWERDNGMDWRE